MEQFDHWMAGLDLTNMDDIILRYLNFLSTINKPDQITFVHIVEEASLVREVSDLFPEIKRQEPLKKIIREKLRKKIDRHLGKEHLDFDIIVTDGKPTEAILSLFNTLSPDLLVLGQKNEYKGEGSIARKVSKYIPCSLLLIAESSTYKLDNIHVPITFSKASAQALREARKISSIVEAEIHVQHVFRYPKQFFPYIPSDQYSERLNKHLRAKYNKFKEKFNLSGLPNCIFTVNEDQQEADRIYDLSLYNHADLIIVGSSNKSVAAALLTDGLADQVAGYNFGNPILIYKEKSEQSGLLKSFLEKD